MPDSQEKQTFWEHLDVLRAALLKIMAVVAVFFVVAFIFKDRLFSILLAPGCDDFATYRLLSSIAGMMTGNGVENFSVELINTGLAGQFLVHMKMAFYAGILCASPYMLYQLFRFVSPALYADERKYAVRVVGGGYIMSVAGVLLGYYLIFPLTFRFLGTYQVSADVANLISLDSYMETLVMMCLAMAVVFEMPVLCWFFAKLGFLTDSYMRRYRRHAIVIILIVAAVITPTSDVFTLAAVSLPMWLLYEASIFLVRRSRKETCPATE